MIWPSWNDWKLVYYGGPLAIILVRKNLMDKKRIDLMREYFMNEFGIFKIDSLMQYHYNKQAIFFYNAHETRLNKGLVKMIYKLYHKKNDGQILILLKENYRDIDECQTIFEAFEKIIERDQHFAIDLDTDKYLPFFVARKPKGTQLLIEFANRGKKVIDSLYPSLKPPMPLIAIMIAMFVFVILWEDIPKWIDQLTARFRELAGG